MSEPATKTQAKGFAYVIAVPVAVLLIAAAMTVYDDYGNPPFKGDARTEAYFAEHSPPSV